MQSDQLLEQTASERLTLEQEYEMQQSWRTDPDKCTFVLLATHLQPGAVSEQTDRASRHDGSGESSTVDTGESGSGPESATVTRTHGQDETPKGEAHAAVEHEQCTMVGDVNLFLNDPHDPAAAEIDVMVAEASVRGCGIGREAVLLMLHYGATRSVCDITLAFVHPVP